ncbi:MAG: hypothetical protein A2W90_15495 [Bacteroidetes bacterium GWF2_42_66]|nr:MAG: hypothetical protein A2W92_08025 [Bacteroidetes bacterium GWA2_42_15]OFY02666.1 MAG: hypothetical protein A2W89_04080 [Bacteroidetes bacterium GWE2_42_39]OFY43865.1 MAG: hypothetical protein A2W90_15495 [Bacteroidetes bacterium GWF2_42_66]
MDKIKILHLEDNDDDSELVLSAMEMGGLQIDYTRVEKEQSFLEQLKNNHFDIVLADYHLPSYDGSAALKVCSQLYPEMPFIIVSGTLGEEIAVEMLKYGASDYLLKQNLKRLIPAIEHALAEARLKKQKQKAEDDLRHSEEKYRKIFENVQDVFFQIDNEGAIMEISPSIFRMNGCPPYELRGKKIVMLYNDPAEYSEMLNRIDTNGEIWDFEVRFKNKEGKVKYVSINAHKLFGPDNIPIGIEGSVRDIDARKHAETELIKAKERAEESDRLKSAFLANISHEIRTPMNGIIGFSSLLKEPVLTGQQKKMYIQIIEDSGKRMLNLINQLVDISKIESGQMKVSVSEANVNRKIDDLYTFFSPETEKKGLHFSFKKGLPDDQAIIRTDPGKLYAILMNLINNAVKFTEKGEVEFGYAVKGETIEFYIKDTGRGIAPEKQQAIFERFVQVDLTYTRNYEGAGLGLSISKAYVEMLEGKIRVESAEGKGSTFYFTLPFRVPE